LLEEHNATLPAQVPGASLEETAQSYMAPAEFQRIEGQKQTAAAMKACIKEYNATLPVPVKTSGSRDACSSNWRSSILTWSRRKRRNRTAESVRYQSRHDPGS
jgi:hypothetical protein